MTIVKKKGFIQGFNWGLYPQAEKFIHTQIRRFLRNHTFTRKLAQRLKSETSTHLIDWIDHIIVPRTIVSEKQLQKMKFELISIPCPPETEAFKHKHSIFPTVLLTSGNTTELCLKPEYIEDCIKQLRIKTKIKGLPFNSTRHAILKLEKSFTLSAVQRMGSSSYTTRIDKDIREYRKAFSTFAKRKRNFTTDKEGLLYTRKLVQKTLKHLSPARTADAFFRNERIYWESRNKAGQVQRKRQDKFGLGWGNHDHHTYRASRKHFVDLIEIFEMMGYECRERFFAGEKAGWGAQVLEHKECDIVLFADLDITKAEKDKDFAHKGVKTAKKLGTVGLWIGLHGESILQAGMHHLEARFDFNHLKKSLPKHNIQVMKPFSNFQFLKQLFTKGEVWKVEKKRAQRLLRLKLITEDEYKRFVKNGAIGSHLENLQRKQGYKGFNQDSVSAIIKACNPRDYHHRGA